MTGCPYDAICDFSIVILVAKLGWLQALANTVHMSVLVPESGFTRNFRIKKLNITDIPNTSQNTLFFCVLTRLTYPLLKTKFFIII